MLGYKSSLLGYELIDYEGIHYYYCQNCYDRCDPWFQYKVADTIEEPFKCEGCREEICEK